MFTRCPAAFFRLAVRSRPIHATSVASFVLRRGCSPKSYSSSSGSQQEGTVSAPLRPGSVHSKNEYTHCVIGGGVVGLAIAARLSKRKGASTLLLERHGLCGTETSSRNSEVIHAGIYYPRDSLKTKLCIRGSNMLYQLCKEFDIPHQRIGKWIVAQTPEQRKILDAIYAHATSLSIPMEWLSPEEASAQEPCIRATYGVLVSPNTGIVSSHDLMRHLIYEIELGDSDIACNSHVTAIKPNPKDPELGYTVYVGERPGQLDTSVTADTVVNAAGLGAFDVMAMLLPEERRKVGHWAKGSYFSYSPIGRKEDAGFKVPKRLVYPAPVEGLGGLGTHLTVDIGGRVKFGPDIEWTDDPTDLKPSAKNLGAAALAIQEYLPGIRKDMLVPDYCGMRPKLAPKGSGFHDFYIREEEGFPGFVNLLGIESPGLTSSLAIGEMVEEILYKDS